MKPLYLYGSTPFKVVLDGPALRVFSDGSSDQRFPLGRVSRVVVSGQVSWTMDALLACADEGIIVCFLSMDGLPRARWIGRPSKRTLLVQRWQNFLDRPDWKVLYDDWRTIMRRRVIRFCALRLGWAPDLDDRKIKAMLYMSGWKAKKLRIAHAHALEELTRVGLSADDPALTRLAPDLAAVVQWGLHPELYGQRMNSRSSTRRNADDLTAFYERHRNTSEFHLRKTLHWLSRYLEELE